MATKVLDEQGLSTFWSKISQTYARIRRDNDYNYSNDFIPQAREICLVDSARGLRAKVGDGVNKWSELPYTDEPIYQAIDDTIQRGFYYNGQFYTDSTRQTLLTPSVETIYIDTSSSRLFIYDGTEYQPTSIDLPIATDSTAGVARLYNNLGQNTDGSVTQKAVTDALNQKVEASVDTVNELLILSTN